MTKHIVSMKTRASASSGHSNKGFNRIPVSSAAAKSGESVGGAG